MTQSLSTNSLISHYRIVSKLGAGGMGEVWLAEDTRLGRKVAVKFLPAEFTEDSDRVRRFTQEAKAASALNHPNIISVHDIGESESGRFIVMEFVSGKTLRDVIAKENSVENLFTLGPQMAKALSAAHAAGITHRDIKPDNIMVRDDGYVKMLDFGLARLLPTTSSDPEGETLAQQTRPGTVIGTLAYMSPEQASGQFATAPSDVFSLGVVLYELTTGQHPFKSETMIGYLRAITSQTPASLISVNPGLSPALDELILRMLEKEADDRPTASEVAQALIDIERHGTTSALPPRTLIKKSEVTKATQDEGFWVAVLPFKYRGANADLAVLAEGLSEDIITGLSRFSILRVIARGSTLRFTGESADLRSIGRQLGARYVMEGSLRQAGSMLRLVVQLVDATTGAHLWAETYDRPFDSEKVFALHDDLVPCIVSSVADWYGALTHSMSEAVFLKPIEKLSPYEAVLRGFGYYEKVTPEEHKIVRSRLEQAVAESPGNADAWAMLSMMYGEEYRFGFNEQPDSMKRALQAARRAVDLAPANHFAFLALAQALYFSKDYDAFRNAAARAIALNPMDGATVEYLGHLIAFSGDWEYGCELAERARGLNPNHPVWYWSLPFLRAYLNGDYVEARPYAIKFFIPGFYLSHVMLGAVYGQLGEREVGAKAVRDLLALIPDTGELKSRLDRWYQPELVEKLMEGLRRAGLESDQIVGTSQTSHFISSEPRSDGGFWVAVLPFKSAGTNSELCTLADGLSEDIVTGLQRFSYLRVIARSSTSRFTSEAADVRQVGQELGARYVMEGSLRQAGAKLRLAVQLIDAATGAHLWAENYERVFAPESLFDLQDDLVPRIVSTIADLHGALPRSLSELVRSHRLEQLSPYESVLRSFGYFDRVTAEALTDALSCVRLAVERAPGNADAWSMLSILCAQDYGQGFELQADALSTSLRAARRAVELAPTNHLAWFSLAQAEFFHKEFQNLENAADRVVELNPMDGNSLAFLGEMFIHVGDWGRGLELARRAKELNPHHPGWYWYADFFNAYFHRDYHGALRFARKANLPNHWGMHVAIATSAGQLGESEVAAKALRELHELRPEFGSIVRKEMKKWWKLELVEHLIDGLRKAGLNISDSEPPTSSASLPDELRASKPKLAPTNLPKDRTRFIGRVHELEHCGLLLADTRLLTLTGLGGSGKTRLAIKLAENLSPHFPDGVWFVDLTPLTETSKVVPAVAQVLDLKEEAGKSLDELLTQKISDQKVLLLLDNCEHLLSACADFVDKLFSSCSEIRILATSREPLSVRGEKVIALHPLEVPAPNTDTSLDTLQRTDAVKLFIDRAQHVQGNFSLTKSNASSIAEICRKLDGIPLAIELAAARVKILTTEQILSKLDDRFKLLSTTGKSMTSRHQTLLAVIEWSYDHLSDEEQRVIRALSVFAGGWTLPLAASVTGGLDEFAMLDLHSQLVDKSIVIVDAERAGIRRYGFLETVRQFLAERLHQNSEGKLVREAHFKAMLSLAEQAYTERISREEYWSEQLEVERDNLRIALEYARETDDENYLQLVGSLGWFWVARTHLFEGHEHLKAALDSSSAEPLRPARARALWGDAQILAIRGNATEAHTLMDEALHTWRQLGDTPELALALEAVGWSHFFSGEDEEALKVFEECLRLQQATGDRHLIIRAMVGLAQILVALGRTAEAIPMSREIIEFSKQHNDKRSEHFGWHYLADCELILGNCDESLQLYKQSLKLAQALGDKVEIGCEVQGVAMSLAGLGQKELAVRYAAAVRAEWDRIGVDIQVPFWDALLDRYVGAAKRSMEVKHLEKEWSEGRDMSFDEVVSLALSQ